jgi:protein gp37
MINQTHFVGSMPVADKSSIEWTEATWNPTTGCNRTSPGCDNCYALTLSRRLKAMGNPKYQNDGDSRTSGPGFGLTLHPEQLDLPHRWAAPRVIFVNSMSDLFHPSVPLTFIREVFEVMRDTPRHTYQVLTKRSARLEKVGTELSWPSNIWMGVSIESNKYVFRADHLRQVPAAVRFISAEPLLGSLSDLSLTGIDWLLEASLVMALDRCIQFGPDNFAIGAVKRARRSFSNNGGHGRRSRATDRCSLKPMGT